MAKKKTGQKKRGPKQEAARNPAANTGSGMYAFRETIESIVIAFVLAFLFRTFEAEAFVIPTGSMSPSLQGQHKDVCCSECGYRFRATASEEAGDRRLHAAAELQQVRREVGIVEATLAGRISGSDRIRNEQKLEALRQIEEGLTKNVKSFDTVVGTCPMCRQLMAMRPDLPEGVPMEIGTQDLEMQKTYPGDRILVNKYCYNGSDPERWDVVVFKFPGNGEMNYIKRLIGLPNETLRIDRGDIYIRDDIQGGDFQIERKPVDKVEAMLQVVHDTDYDPSSLYEAGWPLRWEATSPEGWQVEAKPAGKSVEQNYTVDGSLDGDVQWLQYRHFVPQQNDWAVARTFATEGNYGSITKEAWLEDCKPELIRDFNPYNADRSRGGYKAINGRSLRAQTNGILDIGWEMPPHKYGMHWVGDLAIDCDLRVEKASGEILLRLVEAGKDFICRIDLSNGEATVGAAGFESISATAPTSVSSPGQYRLRFANVDDQLLLWVDGSVVELTEDSAGLTYDAETVFGTREQAIPRASASDPGDLAPAAVGSQGATFEVSRLQVLRDIYYIATRWNSEELEKICDFPHPKIDFTADGGQYPTLTSVRQQFTDPSKWGPRFEKRRQEDFTIEAGQLFVMGDNSPASSDCRLWASGNGNARAKPGGSYLDRRLLIGKAVCVFWPHSWGEIPFVEKLPGFPNFGDMRIVR